MFAILQEQEVDACCDPVQRKFMHALRWSQRAARYANTTHIEKACGDALHGALAEVHPQQIGLTVLPYGG